MKCTRESKKSFCFANDPVVDEASARGDRIVKKTALVLIGALVLPAIVSSSPAEARYWRGGYWRGGGFGFGAPLIAGAVIGGLATSAYAYGPGYYGVPGPYGYYGNYPYDPRCQDGEANRCSLYADPVYGAPVPYGYRYGPW